MTTMSNVASPSLTIGLPATGSDVLLASGPAKPHPSHRGLEERVVRTLVSASFAEMRSGNSGSLLQAIAGQLEKGEGDLKTLSADVTRILDVMKEGAPFLAKLFARLPEWHKRLTSHETGRAGRCIAELAELGDAPAILLKEVRGLKEALDNLGSGRNPGFDSGVSGLQKALKGVGISTYRRTSPLLAYAEAAAAIDAAHRPYHETLKALADTEPATAVEAIAYLENIYLCEAEIRAGLPRAEPKTTKASAPEIQAEAMAFREAAWREMFLPRPEELGSPAALQRLTLGYAFFRTCVGACSAGAKAAEDFAKHIQAASAAGVREAIGMLEARQLCPTVDVRKIVEPLLAASSPQAVPAVAVAARASAEATANGAIVTADSIMSAPRNISPPPANGGVKVPAITSAPPRTASPGQAAPPLQATFRDVRSNIETVLMERFGTRDFATSVLLANSGLFVPQKLDDYVAALDRTRPIWEPQLQDGRLRPQDLCSVAQLDNLEFRAGLAERLGGPLSAEVMRRHPEFKDNRRARAEYVRTLDESRSLWHEKLSDSHVASRVLTRSGLESLRFESEISRRLSDGSFIYRAAKSMKTDSLDEHARGDVLQVIGDQAGILQRVSVGRVAPTDFVLSRSGIEALIARNRAAVELEDLRLAVERDGLPFDLILPVLRLGFLDSKGTYVLFGMSEDRLRGNLKSRIRNFSEIEPLLFETINVLASPGVRGLTSGRNGFGLNQYRTGDLAPLHASIADLIHWIRRERPSLDVSTAVELPIPPAFVPTNERPEQKAFPLLRAAQSRVLVDNLQGAMQAVIPDAPLPEEMAHSVRAISNLAAHIQPVDAKRAVNELVRCYSLIHDTKDEAAKDLVLSALERAGSQTSEGAKALIALTRSPDVLLRRLSVGVLMQATPALVDRRGADGFPHGTEVLTAIFEYIDSETVDEFLTSAAETCLATVRAHNASWDIVSALEGKHRLAEIYLAALVEGSDS